MWCVCFNHCSISFSILCVLQEKRNLVEFNQQIHDFYKYRQYRHFGPLQSKFLYQKVRKTRNFCVSIYLYVYVSVLVLVCPACVSLCLVSNQSNSKNHVIRVKSSVSSMPYCIKHTARSCDVLKTSDIRHLKDVWFKTSWRRPIYVVLKTSNLWRLEDVWFTTF